MIVTVIICAALLLICIFALRSYAKRLSSGCCGASGGKKEKRIRVEDRDESHYPVTKVLTIDGMTCENCVRRVENALNTLEGVWARADLSAGTATVRMKEEIDERALRQAVRSAGYAVITVKAQSS